MISTDVMEYCEDCVTKEKEVINIRNFIFKFLFYIIIVVFMIVIGYEVLYLKYSNIDNTSNNTQINTNLSVLDLESKIKKDIEKSFNFTKDISNINKKIDNINNTINLKFSKKISEIKVNDINNSYTQELDKIQLKISEMNKNLNSLMKQQKDINTLKSGLETLLSKMKDYKKSILSEKDVQKILSSNTSRINEKDIDSILPVLEKILITKLKTENEKEYNRLSTKLVNGLFDLQQQLDKIKNKINTTTNTNNKLPFELEQVLDSSRVVISANGTNYTIDIKNQIIDNKYEIILIDMSEKSILIRNNKTNETIKLYSRN